MTRRLKLLVSKGIRLYIYEQIYLQNYDPYLTHCGYTIVETIAKAKRKATDQLDHLAKKSNTSTGYVFYEASKKNKKISKISPTKSGKRPIYNFFIDYNKKCYPMWCLLDLGSTSFVISPNAAKAFKIPVIKRTKKVQSNDVTGWEILTEVFIPFHWGYPLEIIDPITTKIMCLKYRRLLTTMIA